MAGVTGPNPREGRAEHFAQRCSDGYAWSLNLKVQPRGPGDTGRFYNSLTGPPRDNLSSTYG